MIDPTKLAPNIAPGSGSTEHSLAAHPRPTKKPSRSPKKSPKTAHPTRYGKSIFSDISFLAQTPASRTVIHPILEASWRPVGSITWYEFKSHPFTTLVQWSDLNATPLTSASSKMADLTHSFRAATFSRLAQTPRPFERLWLEPPAKPPQKFQPVHESS